MENGILNKIILQKCIMVTTNILSCTTVFNIDNIKKILIER